MANLSTALLILKITFKFKCESIYSSSIVNPKFVKSVSFSWDNLCNVFLFNIVIRFNGNHHSEYFVLGMHIP